MYKLIILLGVVGSATSPIFARWATTPSMVLVLYRSIIAVLILSPFVLLKHRKEMLRLGKTQLLQSIGSGICFGLHLSLYFESLNYTSIAAAGIITCLEVFFVIFAEKLFWKRATSSGVKLGILIAFAGSVMIVLAKGSDMGALKGNLLALAAVFFSAAYTLFGRTCRQSISTAVYTYIVYFVGALTVFLMLLFSRTPLWGYEPINYWLALGLTIFATLLGHSIYSWGLRYVSVSFISTSKLLIPVFSTVMGIFIFGELPKALVLVGGAVVIFGVYLCIRDKHGSEIPAAECIVAERPKD